MGLNTTAFNIDELITSYADNQISDPETKKQIEELLSKDSKLNAKYRSEVLTKNLLKSRIPEAELPQATYNKVMVSIDGLIADSKKNYAQQHRAAVIEPEYPSFWQTLKQAFTEKFIGVPRYAFAVVIFLVIGGLFVFSSSKKVKNPYILAGSESSIMIQALNSFHKVMNGDVKPQLTSSNAAEIEKYVMDKAHFDPYVPQIENFSLAGVVCNEYHGQQLAHLVYKDPEGRMIYILQVPVTALQKKDLELPDDVHNEITRAKYYMCDEVDEEDCTMTLWYKENNICASMTTMPKQQMYTTFTRFNK